jgi:serine/threonine protein phosphatase PrpC
MYPRTSPNPSFDEGAVRGGMHFTSFGGSSNPDNDGFLPDMSTHSTMSMHSDLSAHGVSLALQGEAGTSSERPSRTRKLRMYHHYAQRIQVGVAQAPARKDQDRFAVDLTDDPRVPHYFGVFDGHGTSALAADLATENLLKEILHADGILNSSPRTSTSLHSQGSNESKTEPSKTEPATSTPIPDISDGSRRSSNSRSSSGRSSSSSDDKRGRHVPSDEAIKAGFYAVEQQVFSHVKDHPRSGTCAVVLFMGIDGSMNEQVLDADADEAVVKLAWVGDCRAVMIDESGKVSQLTRDHRVDDHEGELERVLTSDLGPRDGLLESQQWAVEKENAERAGVRPRTSSFVAKRRIDGAAQGPKCIFAHTGGVSLQISRSIGDCYGPRCVISEPDIVTLRAPASQRARFILASDGVFDVMSSEEAAKCVEAYSDPVKAAAKLCSVAKSKRLYGGRSADDITAIVTDINQKPPRRESRSSLTRGIPKRLKQHRRRSTAASSSGGGGKCAIM